MNIMSTLSEQEVDKGSGDFNEEDETTGEEGSVGSGEHKVIVRMRDKKCLSRPQSDETSRVRCEDQLIVSSCESMTIIGKCTAVCFT